MTTVSFPHGLGDCVYFAHQLPLYQRRGHEVRVQCNPDKRCLFPAPFLAENSQPQPAAKVAWNHAQTLEGLDDTNHWQANKAFANISVAPMPDIGLPEAALWEEFARVRIDLRDRIPASAKETVSTYFSELEKPVILLHTKGNSFQQAKSVPDALAVEIYREIIDQTGGTLILLDWDNRVPHIAHGRIKHLTDDWKRLSVEELLAAVHQADLVVGIDSGPLHLCRYTDTPSVGLWFSGHHPAKYSLPRERQANITLKKNATNGNKHTRWFYNIIEEQGDQIRASTVGRVCRQMLEPPCYLSDELPGKEVVLRHWIKDWTRSGISRESTFVDRDVSFDLMLRHLRDLERPRIVETGCIRAEEDWRGAGFSTYLLGAFVSVRKGKLDSVDLDPKNAGFARKWTRIFGETVSVHVQDSLAYFASRSEPADLLYLDSWDTTLPGHAEHGLREIQAASHLLHSRTVVVYDDTSLLAGKWRGKGSLGVPWMLSHGWKVVHSGHQTVLVRA
jgi:hypothetical protein